MCANLSLVVMPAYNEEKSLANAISALRTLTIPFEVLIVNDGSTDKTGHVAHRLAAQEQFPIHVVELSFNCGIGAAVQTGYRFASLDNRFRYVVQFDADGQHDACSIPALIETCDKEGADLVIGSRFFSPNNDSYRVSILRRVGILCLSNLMTFLMGRRITDPTSGFRCADRKAWELFARHYPDDYPEPESIVYAWRQKLQIAEIPVQMFARREGISSIGNWRGAFYMAKVSLAVLIAWWRRVKE